MALTVSTILVCVDDSHSATSAAQVAAVIARACHSAVTVLGLAAPGANRSAITAAAERVAAMLPDGALGTAVEPTRRVRGRALYERAAAHDLVVVGAHLRRRTIPLIGQQVVDYLASHVSGPLIIARAEPDSLGKMLIGVAGGSQSLAPLRWGVQLASVLGGRADVVHVADPIPHMYDGLPGMAEGAEDLIESPTLPGHVLRHSARYMQRLHVEGHILTPHGDVLEEMLRLTAEGGYNLVVTGSFYARPGIAKYALGNVTKEVALRAPCSVAIVPPHRRPTAHETARLPADLET